MTVGVTANLSTTPSSLQMILKLSPAVGTPGIMRRGVKDEFLSATEIMCNHKIYYKSKFNNT